MNQIDTASMSQTGKKLEDKAEGYINKAADKARDVASDASSKAEGFASTVAGQAKDTLNRAMDTVSDTVSAGKEYLSSSKAQELCNESVSLLKKYPLPSIAIAFGAGLFLGRYSTRN